MFWLVLMSDDSKAKPHVFVNVISVIIIIFSLVETPYSGRVKNTIQDQAHDRQLRCFRNCLSKFDIELCFGFYAHMTDLPQSNYILKKRKIN